MSSSVGKRYEIRVRNKNGKKIVVGNTPTEAFHKLYPEVELVSVHGDTSKADVRIELLDGSRKSVTHFRIGAAKPSAVRKQPAVKKQPAVNKGIVSEETITAYLRRVVPQEWEDFACRNILAKKSDNFGNTYVLCWCTWTKKEPRGYTGFYNGTRLVYHGAKGFTDITQLVLRNVFRGYYSSLNDIGADSEGLILEMYKGNLVWFECFEHFRDVFLISAKGNVAHEKIRFGEGEADYTYTHKLIGDILTLEQSAVVNLYRPPVVHREQIDLAQMLKSMK